MSKKYFTHTYRLVGVGRMFNAVCLFVCLFVCEEHNSKKNDYKVFKLGIGANLLAFRGQQSLLYNECRMPQLASFCACHHVTTSARALWNCTGCQYVIASSSNWHNWCTWQTTSLSDLCSADITDFIVPKTKTKFGERAFCVSGPTIWNSSSRVSSNNNMYC